jgi:hypothetical protein
MRARGVSLWLVPADDVRVRLAERIGDFARRLGTPRFEPHVTLLGGINVPGESVIEKTQTLIPEFEPIHLRLTRPGRRDEFFRCLFLEVAPTPALTDAHRRARALFGKSDEPPFFPHLSLVYGTLAPEAKNALLLELEQDASWRAKACASELWVVLTEGTVDEWRVLAKLPMARPAS